MCQLLAVSFLKMALAALADVFSISDVVEEISELVPALSREDIREIGMAAAASGGVPAAGMTEAQMLGHEIGVVAGQPAPLKSVPGQGFGKRRKIGHVPNLTRQRHGKRKSDFTTPTRVVKPRHFSISPDMGKVSRSISTGRRGASTMIKVTPGVTTRRRRRKTRHSSHIRTSRSILARAQKKAGAITVVKRLAAGPTPTTQESGGTMSDVITAFGSKTTPNGQFAFSYSFNLAQFPNYAEFTGAYQWYKILWVKLIFYPEQNCYPSLREGDATNPIKNYDYASTAQIVSRAPFLITAPDHASESLFASKGEAMAHDGAVLHCFNDQSEKAVWISPKATGLVGSAGSEIVTLTRTPQWITTDSATVPHYGLRCFADTFTSASSLRCVMEMKVAFKGAKL